jgi:hypothetical protein
MSSPKFNSVEEYFASVDPAKERTLRSVIDLILAEFPELESNDLRQRDRNRRAALLNAFEVGLTSACSDSARIILGEILATNVLRLKPGVRPTGEMS